MKILHRFWIFSPEFKSNIDKFLDCYTYIFKWRCLVWYNTDIFHNYVLIEVANMTVLSHSEMLITCVYLWINVDNRKLVFFSSPIIHTTFWQCNSFQQFVAAIYTSHLNVIFFFTILILYIPVDLGSLFDFCPVGGVLYVYRVVANLLRVRRECEWMCKFDKNGSKYIYKFWNFPKMCLWEFLYM